MSCNHADSGCNYPEGECLGTCMASGRVNLIPRAPAPRPNHTVRRVATVLFFVSLGMCLTVLHHDYTITLQRENDALRALNMQLLRDGINEQHCVPRNEHSKAIMQRVNGELRCELHTKGV